MDAIKNAIAPLLEQLGKLSARTRTLLAAVAVLGLAVAVALVLLASKPDRILFSGLDPRDAAAVVAALDAAKIEHELDSGGTLIRVAQADINKARLLLAEQDLPGTGNVGFELFAEQNFGLTDFAQQVNYRRALQGELERTITSIQAVGNARVHVTLPRKAVFEDEKISPTASVTLQMVQGRVLNDRNVGAIRHLVASAVEGLNADGVTVLDTKGRLLSRAGSGNGVGTAALDYEKDLEHELERRVTQMLERTIGVGGAQVQVAAEIDFSRTDTTEEVYDPEQIAVRNESTQEMVEGPGGARPRGVAGAQANIPGANTAGAGGRGTGSSRTVVSKQYEVNRTVVHTVGPEATVKRLTVAVMVDGNYTPAEDGGEPVFTPRSAEELAELQAVVESAIGFSATRGDRIKIASVPFQDRPQLGELGLGKDEALMAWLPYAVGGGLLALAAIVWFVMARRKKKKALEAELLTLPATVNEAQAALRGETVEQAALAEPEPMPPQAEEILKLAAQDPERTADIIRAWIAQDETAA